MRELKFRGIPLDWDQFVYGSYVKHENRHYIYTLMYEKATHIGILTQVQVHSDSVGQYTGLKDKTGKEIYEGDILQCKCGMWRLDGKQTDKISIKNYEVKWEQITGRWNLYKNGKFELLQPFNKEHLVTWYTVIGNIHENPELLGDV